jgi:hypothetical protein
LLFWAGLSQISGVAYGHRRKRSKKANIEIKIEVEERKYAQAEKERMMIELQDALSKEKNKVDFYLFVRIDTAIPNPTDTSHSAGNHIGGIELK